MPTVLDILEVQTRIDLGGLQTGIRDAERMAAQAKGRIAAELGAATFQVNTSEATAQLRALSESTIQLHASLVQLRAQLAQPFKVTVDTSDLRRAARDIADVQAAMAGAGVSGATRSRARTASATATGAETAGGPIVVRGAGSSVPIVVSGPVVVTASGSSGGAPPAIPPRIVLPGGGMATLPPSGFGGFLPPPPGYAGRSTITMPPGSYSWLSGGAGVPPPWGFTGFATSRGWGSQFVNPGLMWGQQFVPPGQAATFTPGAVPTPGQSASRNMFAGIGNSLMYAGAITAAFTAARELNQIWNEIVESGTQFNATMETGQINLAALLSQGREFRSASGQTVDTLTNYKLQLGAAATQQKELVRLDAETLGSAQDLQGVYAQVLAHTRGQVATDAQRLTLTSAILNASTLMGNTQQQHTIETRQTLLGQSHVGNVILMNLGISNKQIQSWREQGILVEELLKRLELFNRLGKDAGQTWQGLATSMGTLRDQMAATTGAGMFEGLRQLRIGEVAEMRRQQDAGEVYSVPLGVSDASMQEAGANIARVRLALAQGVLSFENTFIRLGVAILNTTAAVKAAWDNWQPPWWARKAGEVAGWMLAPGGGFETAQPTITPDAGLTKESINTQVNRLAVQLNSLASVDTSSMSQATFQKFLLALSKGQEETNKLRDATNQLHGMNGLTEEDFKKITADIVTLNKAYDLTIAQFEKGIPVAKGEDGSAARARERLLDMREARTRAADSAELALQQRMATITGDTAGMEAAAQRKIEDERAKGIREAKGDAETIAAVNRRYYAEKANLEIDATARFLANSRREGDIAEETAQRKLRALQLQNRTQASLADAELNSIRRQLQIADRQGASPEVMTGLLQREAAAIERIRQLQVAGAVDLQTVARQRVTAIESEIAALQRLTTTTREAGGAWRVRQAGDVNAPFVSTGVGGAPIGSSAASTELNRERIAQLNGELLTWQTRAQDAGDAQVLANQRAANATDTNTEAQRRLNMTVGQRIQERLAQDARGSADTFANIWVRGIDRVSDALADMATKGKFSFRSLLEISNEISREIMSESIRGVIRQGLGVPNQMPGGSMGGIFDGLFGGGSNKSPGVATVATTATTGIQQITATGTTGLTTLQTTSTTGITQIHAVASAAIAAIQSQAGAGGTFGNVLSGGSSTASGGGMFGNVLSGGSSTAPGGTFGNVLSGSSSTAGAPGGRFMDTFNSFMGDGGILSIIYQLGSLLGGATGSKTGGTIGGFFGGITGLIASLFHEGGFVPHFASGGFAGNEVPAILHRGEMVLSAAETRNLTRYGSARMPGGKGSIQSGGGSMNIINMHIHGVQDVNGFKRNQGQIEASVGRGLARSNRRNN